MTNKHSRRFMSAFCALLVAVVSGLGASCQSAPDAVETTGDEAAVTTGATEETTELPDDLPDENFDGYEFMIATETENEWMVLAEEATGDVVDDALYERNIAVEERFNVKFTTLTGDHTSLGNLITSSVQAGDDEIDLCCTHVVNTGSLALNGLFVNWYEVPYVDFSKPWWAPSTTNDLSVNNKCVLAISDFSLTALANTYCVFYNKQLAEDYGIGDLYKIASDGAWTIDKLTELSRDIYVDLNGDNTQNNGDRYGFVSTSRSALNAYLWSFGGKVLSKNESGGLELVYHNDKTADMVQKLCQVFYENTGIYINSKEATYDSLFSINMFLENKAVFINANIGQTLQYLREMENDYGILPYPKWDEAQTEYYTMVDGSHDILAVPITATNLERTGIITEALSAESYKRVIPAYYETALKTKYARDDESVQMLDMIANSRIFDLGYVYDGWSGASFIFQELISANNTSFESTWASRQSSIEAHYNEVIEFFES